MNVHVHLDTKAGENYLVLFLPYHQEHATTGIYHTCISDLKKCIRGLVKQHFQRSLDRNLDQWMGTFFPKDPFYRLL